MRPWCVAIDAGGVQMLQPGLLARTNGLPMLADHGSSAAMRDEAQRVSDSLQDGAWPSPTAP